jgi:hypothetical protein
LAPPILCTGNPADEAPFLGKREVVFSITEDIAHGGFQWRNFRRGAQQG